MEQRFVVKRDGRRVRYQEEKIIAAMRAASEAVENGDVSAAASAAYKKLEDGFFSKNAEPTVEQIQDIVERELMAAGHYEAAKAYILYRNQHEELRNFTEKVSPGDLVDQYLNLNDWRVNENSNMSYSLQGLNNYVSSAVTSKYWLAKVYPPELKVAHESGDIHLHDLGTLGPYCCGWDLKDLLMTGIKGVGGKIESAPAKHFRTALGHVVNFFFTLQGEAAGAQAFSSFDTYLAPFVRFDGLTYPQVVQAMQEFVFNLNVPTRVGFQTPFTNITLDLKPNPIEANQPVVIGGKLMKETYGEFQEEMDMINRAFAEVMSKGDAKGRVFTFPIPTYNITKEFNWDEPILQPIMEMTAKYGIPYFANYVNSDMNPEDARSMCCRLRLDNRVLRKRGGGLFGANPLTGSIGVVTINMPRIGYLATDESDYFRRFDRLVDLAVESLLIKRKFIERLTDHGLYPYSKYYLREVKERMGEYWTNHFNTIGIIGMNESMLNFFGSDKGIASEEGRALSLKLMDYARERMLALQEETGQMFNLEATPGEGITYRFAQKDLERFADIITANNDRAGGHYYTNSTHLPVSYTDDAFEMLDLQDEFQTKYTGGTVVHLFLGERMPDPEATKKLVRAITSKYHLPYFSITPTFSVCPQHGYLAGEHEYCPKCDELLLCCDGGNEKNN